MTTTEAVCHRCGVSSAVANTIFCSSCDPWASNAPVIRSAPRRSKLLAEAADKPVKPFAQYDGWPDFGDGDYVMKPDENGDVVMSSDVHELRNGTPLRVQIEPGVTRTQAARLLRTIAGYIEGADQEEVYPNIPELPGESPF